MAFNPETFCSDGQCQRAPVNVDCLSDSELDALIDHPGTHREVKHYAELIHDARIYRKTGNVAHAARLEAKADRIYRTIPRHLHW